MVELPPYYRGVSPEHPGYADALNGIAMPGNTAAKFTPDQAIFGQVGPTQFTNWSPFKDVASDFAGSNGVIMEAPRTGLPWSYGKPGPDPGEAAVLLKGRHEGLRVYPNSDN